MIKTACAALAAAALGVAMAPEAKAETKFYANPEYNQGFQGSNSLGGQLDLHVGVENGPLYLQLGPALQTGTGTSEWGVTGKVGASGEINERMSLYAEASAGKFRGADTAYGLKVGTKFRL